MHRRGRHIRRPRAVVLGIVALAAMAGCSAKHDPVGGIVLAVDTNLRVPDDLDSIGISVTSANVPDGGSATVTYDNIFALAPSGSAKFPATLAVIRGTDQPIAIRAVGYKSGTAITLRNVVTTLPSDDVALLHLELNWLDEALVAATSSEDPSAVHLVTSTCPSGEAPVGGACASFTLDSAQLPVYDAGALPASDGPASVDCNVCFEGAQTVVPDPSTCTFAVPAGVSDATQLNIALRPASESAGWCNGGTCVIPVVNDQTLNAQADGWSVGSDGLVHLPAGACANPKVSAILVALPTASCPAMSAAHPVQQQYGADAGEAIPLDAGGDATLPPVDAGHDGGRSDGDDDAGDGGDASSSDAGPYASLPRSGVVSIAADTTSLYILTDPDSTQLETIDLAFATGSTGTTSTLTNVALAAGTNPESVAAAPYYGVQNAASGFTVVNLDTLASTALQGSTGPTGLTMAAIGDASAELAFVRSQPGAAYYDMIDGGLPTLRMQPTTLDSTATVVGLDPASPLFQPRYATGGTGAAGGPYVMYGPPGNQALAAQGFAATPVQFAFPFSGPGVTYLDGNGLLHLVVSQSSVVELAASAAATTPRSFAGANGRVYWIGARSGQLYGGAVDAMDVDGGTTPLALLPDGGAPSGAAQVLLKGRQLIWFDQFGVYRFDTTALP